MCVCVCVGRGEACLEAEFAVLWVWGVVLGDEVGEAAVAQAGALCADALGVEAVVEGVHVDVQAQVG